MKLHIVYDLNPDDPRTNCFSKMICFHKKYILGDKHNYNEKDFSSWKEVRKKIEEDFSPVLIKPLYLMDHSGLALSTGGFYDCDPQGWDWGQVGFIFVTEQHLREAFGDVKNAMERAQKIIENELCEYNKYLNGECYGFIVSEDEERVDSCFGFGSTDDACQAGKEAISVSKKKFTLEEFKCGRHEHIVCYRVIFNRSSRCGAAHKSQ